MQNSKITSLIILVVAPRRGQDLISVCKSVGEDFTEIIFDYNSDKSLAYEGQIGTYFALAWALVLVLSGIQIISIPLSAIYKYAYIALESKHKK